jgi:hypothetical protein
MAKRVIGGENREDKGFSACLDFDNTVLFGGGMERGSEFSRRIFLGEIGGLLSAGAVVTPQEFIAEAGAADKGGRNLKEKDAEGVAPAEDLMREHGVLSRLLLIYDAEETQSILIAQGRER